MKSFFQHMCKLERTENISYFYIYVIPDIFNLEKQIIILLKMVYYINSINLMNVFGFEDVIIKQIIKN